MKSTVKYFSVFHAFRLLLHGRSQFLEISGKTLCQPTNQPINPRPFSFSFSFLSKVLHFSPPSNMGNKASSVKTLLLGPSSQDKSALFRALPQLSLQSEELQGRQMELIDFDSLQQQQQNVQDLGGRMPLRVISRRLIPKNVNCVAMIITFDADTFKDESANKPIPFDMNAHLARSQLSETLVELNPQIPVLIFANFVSLPKNIHPQAIAGRLYLHAYRNQNIHIQLCCLATKEGLAQGIQWMVFSGAHLSKKAQVLEEALSPSELAPNTNVPTTPFSQPAFPPVPQLTLPFQPIPQFAQPVPLRQIPFMAPQLMPQQPMPQQPMPSQLSWQQQVELQRQQKQLAQWQQQQLIAQQQQRQQQRQQLIAQQQQQQQARPVLQVRVPQPQQQVRPVPQVRVPQPQQANGSTSLKSFQTDKSVLNDPEWIKIFESLQPENPPTAVAAPEM